jgi:hypothetical protein
MALRIHHKIGYLQSLSLLSINLEVASLPSGPTLGPEQLNIIIGTLNNE